MTFIADVHLGKLARILRLLGFDVYWRNDLEDGEIAAISARTGRVVLTRDRELLRRKAVRAGLLVASTDSVEQAAQVVSAFHLSNGIRLFSLCSACGGQLETLGREAASDLVPVAVRGKYDRYFRCASCGKMFWKGDHFRTLEGLLDRLETALGRPIPREPQVGS